MRIRFSPLLATGARTMVPTLVLFAVFLLLVGHNVPGGGFAGGLLLAAALVMVYLAFGERGVRLALPARPETLTGAGLGLALLGGLVGWLTQGAFLGYGEASVELPVVGAFKLTTLLLFDLGVFVLVVGLVATATVHLGRETP